MRQESSGLSVSGLKHSYGRVQALSGVDFDLEAGAFCALLGPNGAGKSTLFSLLTRLFVPDAGSVRIGGIDLAANPGNALAKMGVVFQQPTLDLDLSVQQNMLYYAALHGVGKREAKPRIGAVLERLGMAKRAGEKVRSLNGGHRRRMEIARALLHEPSLLLLDEPTVGLDIETRRTITDHVHQLAAEERLTVLWATHLADEVNDDDRLVVINDGTIVADGLCKDIRGNQTLLQVFAELTAAKVA